MSKIMEDMRNEAARDERARLVLKMVSKGYSIEAIAECFEMSVEEVQELIGKRSA